MAQAAMPSGAGYRIYRGFTPPSSPKECNGGLSPSNTKEVLFLKVHPSVPITVGEAVKNLHTIFSCITAVASCCAVLAIVYAAWELEENKKATKARITLDYELAGIQIGQDTLSDPDFEIFMRDGLSFVPEEKQHQLVSNFVAFLTWYQIGFVQWRDGYISDNHWEPLKRDMCWTVDGRGGRELFSNDLPHPLRVVFTIEFFKLIEECLRDPETFISKSLNREQTEKP